MVLDYINIAVVIALVVWAGVKLSADAKKRTARNQSRRQANRPARPRPRYTGASGIQHSNSVLDLVNSAAPAGDTMGDAMRCLKFGRTAQAIDILKPAFRAQPEALEIGLKLAELLLSTNDVKEFHKVEEIFQAVTKEKGPFWEAFQILKTDYFGTYDNHENSVYTDFSRTKISNLSGLSSVSGFSSLRTPSQNVK